MRKTSKILAALALAALGGVAQAAPIFIDHDGAGPLPLAFTNTWDWEPGNALATTTTGGTTTVGGNRAISNFALGNAAPKSFDLLYHARMATILDQGGSDITAVTSTLNSPGTGYEITIVAGFKEDVTGVLVAPGSSLAQFGNPAVPGLNYFEVYFDKLDAPGGIGANSTGGVRSNNLSGEGFNDGRLIAKGSVTLVQSFFGSLAGTGDLDQFGGVDDYPMLDTINGQGVTTLTAMAEIADLDPTFFPAIVANALGPDLTFELFTSTQTTPFATADPSAAFSFTGNPAAVGSEGAGVAETTSGAGLGVSASLLGLGSINGLQLAGGANGIVEAGEGGESVQFQADASNTFLAKQNIVPEPATAMLGLMGLAGLALRRRTA